MPAIFGSEYLEVSRREYFHHGTVNKKFDGSSIGDEVTKGSCGERDDCGGDGAAATGGHEMENSREYENI
uniref:Uncharacterized protein n=1 Tax=Vespula pensylvanica TaxID=30213 RepID=A0A834UA51_VESPE|nr:hypothetical protein H0235_007775 [Vespula pensylvanica]